MTDRDVENRPQAAAAAEPAAAGGGGWAERCIGGGVPEGDVPDPTLDRISEEVMTDPVSPPGPVNGPAGPDRKSVV